MDMIKRITVFLILFIATFHPGFSQEVAIGQWRDELPYNRGISVAEAESRMYCATPYAIFYDDKTDNTVVRLSKITGLSDIGISSIRYSKDLQTLIIAYTDANIDLIKSNTIINISDIKRAAILGNSTINRIDIIGPYAYLSCGFGIVVLDIDKEEIHDTYYIGQGGNHVNVFGIVKDNDDTLYAATEVGIYKAYYDAPNLVDFASWHKDPGIDSNSRYNAIAFFSGEVIAAKANALLPADIGSDTLYRHSGHQWTQWQTELYKPVMNLEATYNYFCVSYNSRVYIYDSTFSNITKVSSYNPGNPFPLDAITDKDNVLWIGDQYGGLISHDLQGDLYQGINLSGPLSADAFSMTANGNDLYIARGGKGQFVQPNIS